MMLQHIASDNKYSQNHPYRVSVTASKIAEQMELGSQRVEDVRAAALLHEIDKVGITNEMLYQAANMSVKELHEMQANLEQGKELPRPQGGALRRIIPTLLAHHVLMEKAKDVAETPECAAGGAHPAGGRCVRLADQRPGSRAFRLPKPWNESRSGRESSTTPTWWTRW